MGNERSNWTPDIRSPTECDYLSLINNWSSLLWRQTFPPCMNTEQLGENIEQLAQRTEFTCEMFDKTTEQNQRDLTWVSSSFDLSFKKYHLFEDQLGHRIGCATKAHIKRQTIVSEMLRIVEGTVTSSHKICIVDQHSQTPTLHSVSVNKLGWRERKKESERGRERAREGRGREVAERESEN